jgi:N-acetylglucosaminyldiphosphoundecaprenol N-acetyl-beta-D-mannosaminyltransferase
MTQRLYDDFDAMNPINPMNSKVDVLGCRIDNLSMEETLARIEEFIREGKAHQHVVVNVDKIVKAKREPRLMEIINGCDLVNADGMPVVWASQWLGKPLKERVAGIDLFVNLVGMAARKGWRVFFFGAREEVVSRAVAFFEEAHPGLRVAGFRNGYWKPEEEPSVVEEIKRARPDILLVAISSPKKEEFLDKHMNEMKIPFAMGVGGSFDVVAGLTSRAPLWMQKRGLEWFYRFLQEPRRMFRRYFMDDLYFFWLLTKELLKAQKVRIKAKG